MFTTVAASLMLTNVLNLALNQQSFKNVNRIIYPRPMILPGITTESDLFDLNTLIDLTWFNAVTDQT